MRHAWKAKERPCRVYWGTHGCRKQRGHLGKHLCQPGCGPAPTDPGVLYGEDAPNREEPKIVIPPHKNAQGNDCPFAGCTSPDGSCSVCAFVADLTDPR